jgi:LacI family transcriptional regulator, galactose operon repressor
MPTIRDVAKRAGVSVGTVSHVLIGTGVVRTVRRERVLQAIRELDYEPNSIARSLKTRQTKMLGAVVSDITNPFYPQMIRGAEDAALHHQYVLLTVNTDDHIERERRFLSILLARRVDGVLLVSSPNNNDQGHLERALKSGTPVVGVDRYPEGIDLDAVYVDNVKGARMCINHLIRLGHRRIAYLGGNWAVHNAKDRLEGYRQELEAAGIPVNAGLIADCDFRQQSGYRVTKDLCLRPDGPTAIFSGNAMMGVGALQAVQELGIHCPRQISISMFDDVPFGEVMQPRLTTVAQPAYQIGYRAAELLISRIEGTASSNRPVHVQLEPELVVRNSTGPPPREEPGSEGMRPASSAR